MVFIPAQNLAKTQDLISVLLVLCIAKFSVFLNGLFLKATRKMMNESDWEEKLGLIWTGKYEWKVEIILEKFTKTNFIIMKKDCFG